MEISMDASDQVILPTSTSQVRVGVRVRPLTSKEQSQGGKSVVTTCSKNRTVGILERKFTYDAVYDSNVSQQDLYHSVGAGGMLESFLEGYNATIMAYGQTGSGKTFTMGSEADSSEGTDSSGNGSDLGLIPRFMTDVFLTLQRNKEGLSNGDGIEGKKSKDSNDASKKSHGSQHIDYKISASFLEVYGEDVHDLLDEDRKSLPLREDASGGVVVVGLKSRVVENAEDALNVLHVGTMNRTTAATLMNHTSSRSHAVFTVYLQQTTSDSGSDAMEIMTSSRFTFVDLAGSERMKKTGAEGERAREGIEINKGLLALGNVINALADEERLAKGEKVHVPYRQSKLTRLLQDALGGNSQTLFLACVSPSDTNASETISTLKYANRARNIKNAPTKNVDASLAEIQRLRVLTQVLQCELVKSKFLKDPSCTLTNVDGKVENINEIGDIKEDLLQRRDVQEYIHLLHKKVEQKQSSALQSVHNTMHDSSDSEVIQSAHTTSIPMSSTIWPTHVHPDLKATKTLLKVSSSHFEEFDDTLLDVNPDEDMALLDKLLEIQNLDQEFDQEQKKDQEELNQVEGELQEQENMLLQLKESLKAYHNMKAKYEVLMGELQNLEAEKTSLAAELENVQLDPTKGCSKAIKKRLESVELNLARARSEARKHQQMYRKAEQEAQKCRVLERKIEDLKHGRVALIRKQKEAATKHREFTETKTREIQTLKRKERKTGQKMSKLEAEVQKHKANLNKRNLYCNKLSEKLKQTESHLLKLLSMRKQDLYERTRKSTLNKTYDLNPNKGLSETKISDEFAPQNEEFNSLKFLLEKLVSDRVSVSLLKSRYQDRVSEYSEIMRSMSQEMKDFQLLQNSPQFQEHYPIEEQNRLTSEHEQNVEELEFKLEVVGADLEDIRSRLPNIGDTENEDVSLQLSKNESSALKMIANLRAPIIKTLLWDTLDVLSKSETEKSLLAGSLQRKESAVKSFENEVSTLNQRIEGLSKEIEKRRRISSDTKSGEDVLNVIQRMEEEIKVLNVEISRAEAGKNQATHDLKSIKESQTAKDIELATMKEKLTVMDVAIRNSGPSHETADDLLRQLQLIWKTVGTSVEDREIVRCQIETCLEDTCARTLDGAKLLQKNILEDINTARQKVESVYKALGLEEKIQDVADNCFTSLSMMEHLEALRDAMSRIRPTYDDALRRRTKVSEEVEGMIKVMDLQRSELTKNLQLVLKSKRGGFKKRRAVHNAVSPSVKLAKQRRARIFKDVEEMVKALEPLEEDNDERDENDRNNFFGSMLSDDNETSDNSEYIDEPLSLSEPFLEECESEVKRLKLIKSKRLVSNSTIRDNARSIAKEMHLRGRELISLSIHSVKKRKKDLPEWWNPQLADEVCRTIVSKESVVGISDSFRQHLDLVYESLQSVAIGRGALSETLKGVVEGAHSTLLIAVEGEMDASEAYASFHDALFRLPSLSKEHIHACIEEMNILVSAVEAMAQSEIEALTVVWEAMSISSSERGIFWGEVEEATKSFQAQTDSPFDSVRHACTIDIEEWVLTAVKDSTKVHRVLSAGLLKLSKVHEEVEKLRSKQDAKSKIMSLDSELRILSAKLTEFEEKAGSKQRLVTKKKNSAALLKEERFRKQMQNNFASKLQNLGKLLHEWEKADGNDFDSKLLSEDVRKLLKNDGNYDNWVEQRTAFMHLKTVKQNKRRNVDVHARDRLPNDQFMDSCIKSNSGRSTRPQPTGIIARAKPLHSPSRKKPSDSKRKNVHATSPMNQKPGSPSRTEKEYDQHIKSKAGQKRTFSRGKIKKYNSPSPKKAHRIHNPLSPIVGDNTKSSPKTKKNGKNISDTEPLLPFGQVLSATPSSKENRRV